jgi:predicted RNase H-like HicB family nuclease
LDYILVFEPSDEGGVTVYGSALPGCISEGNSKEGALSNIQEAIEMYLELVDDDLIIDEQAIIQKIEV